MKIAVFGATGGTGLAFLDQALAAGHSLRALVRDQTKISETTRANANLELVKGDLLFNAKSVASTLEGCDGLFITLGGRGVPDVCSRGTGIILDAVKEAKMDPKTVAVTSFGVGDSREDANGYLIRFFLWAIIGAAIADKDVQEEKLKNAGLSHLTIVRPGGLTNDVPTGKWRAGKFPSSGSRISRSDVAAFCLQCFADDSEWKGKTPTLTSRT